MKGRKSDLQVVRSGRDITLTNGVIQLRLVYRDGGFVQEFYGIDRRNQPCMLLSTIHRNLIPFTEHRLMADPMISGRRNHLFEVNRDSLRMSHSDAQITESDDMLQARLSGHCGEYDLATTIQLRPGSKFVHVTIEAEIAESPRPPIVEYLMAAYAFLPDEMLIDRYKKLDYAWAPSLRPADDNIIGERSFRSPAAVVQLKRLVAAIIPDPNAKRTLPVCLDLDLKNGLVSAPLLAYGLCDSEPDGCFSYHDRSMLLHPKDRRLSFSFWLYLDADASPSGGFLPIQQFIWENSAAARKTEPVVVDIKSSGDSLASVYYSKSASGQSYEDVIENTLADQMPCGLFRSTWQSGPQEGYSAVESAKYAQWLLAIHRDTGADLRIIAAGRALGDFLKKHQMPLGIIPSLYAEDLTPLPEVKGSAETAVMGRFLADLAEVTGNRSYLACACKAARYCCDLVAKKLYFTSKSLDQNGKLIRDTHTEIYLQSCDAMRTIADLLIAAYRVTKENRYLKSGLESLNQMCWYQDTWNTIQGVFAAGNASDEEVNHSLFGHTLLEYYEVTHVPEYMERGLTAIRAGLLCGDPKAPAVRAWAVKRFGSALIDTKNHTAFTPGLCSVSDLTTGHGVIAFKLQNGFTNESHNPVTVKFFGLRGDSYKITINGEGNRYSKVELESGIKVWI
ncbi:MAG TPA: hypothetical protein PKV43_08160 [Armatimonadota bacterium]|nr:hypothetical protein [Armatimonadota bacterium]